MFDRTIMPSSLISTKGLKAATILAALYNAASKIGHGEKDSSPATITETEARAIIKSQNHLGFDYLNGKRLKLDMIRAEESGIIAGQYDYGQGCGTAARAIAILRETGDPCHHDIIALQEKSKVAAKMASAPLRDSGTTTEGNFAQALELTDHSTEDKPDYEFQRLQKLPCTTITL